MKRNVPFRDSTVEFLLDIRPNCPYCNVSVEPIILASNYPYSNTRYCYVTMQCPSCEGVWADTYHDYDGHQNFIADNKQFFKPDFAQLASDIKLLSPKGARTYEQALQAEDDGYDTLVGIGLRKALEFFLKDFLIATNPDKEDDIKKRLLGQVIADYIHEPNLLALSKATAWIGNDETHYIRKHTDQDLEDLKRFLKATINHIQFQLTILDALDFVNKSN